MALTKVTGQVINDTTGLVVGVTTVGGGLSATDGFFSGIVTAVGDASFSGNVSVGGTLTYEDVTNIDAVGLITARNGVVVGSGITLSKDGDIFATGITTISENLKVGTGVTISPDGDGFYTGVVTATTFKGDGSQLSNITSTTINNNADNRVITGSGSANTLEGESTLTFTNTGSTGQLNLKRSTSSNQEAIFSYGSSNLEIETRESTGIKFKTNQSDRVSIAASTGFMTNVNPVFMVKPSNGTQSSPNNTLTKINFDEHVITERGGGFDFTNNRFVAPIAGYYHFAYTIYCYTVYLAYIDVYKNGSQFHRNWGIKISGGGSVFDNNPHCPTGAVNMLLDKNDYVELYSTLHTGTTDPRIFSASSNPTIFMGHLIG